MESGVKELQAAINRVTGLISDGTDGIYTGLETASEAANNIANSFYEINGALAAGWENVSDFYVKISTIVETKLTYVRDIINRYVNLTMENEEKERESLLRSNEEVENILNEMGI